VEFISKMSKLLLHKIGESCFLRRKSVRGRVIDVNGLIIRNGEKEGLSEVKSRPANVTEYIKWKMKVDKIVGQETEED
jgi:hypothetical protein